MCLWWWIICRSQRLELKYWQDAYRHLPRCSLGWVLDLSFAFFCQSKKGFKLVCLCNTCIFFLIDEFSEILVSNYMNKWAFIDSGAIFKADTFWLPDFYYKFSSLPKGLFGLPLRKITLYNYTDNSYFGIKVCLLSSFCVMNIAISSSEVLI